MHCFKKLLNTIINIMITLMYIASIIGMITDLRIGTEKGFLVYFLLFILAIMSTLFKKKETAK